MPAGSVSVTSAGVVTKSGIAGQLFDQLKLTPAASEPAGPTPVENNPVFAPVLKGMAVTANAFAPVLGGAIPTGIIAMWSTASAPTDWLLCDGAAVSRTTYATLFALIGTTYGSGDGSTTFNVPDFRGRSPMGSGTGDAIDATNHVLTAKTGAETQTLSTSQMPVHTHTVTDPAHSHLPSSGTGFVVAGAGSTLTIAAGLGYDVVSATGNSNTLITLTNAGSGNAHPNVHPVLTVNFIIKT